MNQSIFDVSIQERRRKLKKARTEEEEIAHRIATEERMLLVAQRKLESIRVLDDVLERVKVIMATSEAIWRSFQLKLIPIFGM